MPALTSEAEYAANRLSNELLTLILEHVEPDSDRPVPVDRRQFLSVESFDAPRSIPIGTIKDICCFRLASRRFAELGAPFLFTRITTRLSSRGLSKLEQLSRWPWLAQHVRKFSYMVPAFYTGGVVRSAVFLPRLEAKFGRDNVARFEAKIEDQQRTISSGEDLRVLTAALAAFTCLQHVQLLRVQDEEDTALLAFLEPSEDTQNLLRLDWGPACFHVTRTIGLALVASRNTSWSRLSTPMLNAHSMHSLQSKQLMNFSILAERITCLTLHFEDYPGFEEKISELSASFRAVFLAAKNMQAVHVGFPMHWPLDLPLATVFHNIFWDRLLAFGIQGWKLDADEILDLAYRHRDRLKGLRLRDVLLKEGSAWRDVLTGLRECMRSLDWISLRRIGYAEHFERFEGRHLGIEVQDEVLSDTESDFDELYTDSSAEHSTAALSDSDDDSANASDDERGAAAHDMDFPPFSPDRSGLRIRQECGQMEDLEDDGGFISNAKRKAWEKWVVARHPDG